MNHADSELERNQRGDAIRYDVWRYMWCGNSGAAHDNCRLCPQV